ncbi:riboflavin synthase alpha chain [Actinopolyspora xinjiangensis]|uniref:Riboflavin synthase n=1 Tax=Actinopolyspora xinjiangensis TaxID=405564 RepID=A0A1H0WFV8_9ACTN|nr:riboflavin synthase [Actinopolyspora xinjiangensis]SDP89431.1 riboflavin synthase alpha chain [Actinopolyspora xinjiangensis]
MFTGIVEELGEVVAVERSSGGARFSLGASVVTGDASHGDSIAVNGVCLTVVEVTENGFDVDVVDETLRRSTLADLAVGDRVNLERAMALGDRLGGHIVQGHVDATATVLGVDSDGLTEFSLPPHLSHYLVEKGSVTVDGVSLTVVAPAEDRFSVALIPTTRELTTLGLRAPGDRVNIEVDALAKHVERLMAPQLDRLARTGTRRAVDNGESREQAR